MWIWFYQLPQSWLRLEPEGSNLGKEVGAWMDIKLKEQAATTLLTVTNADSANRLLFSRYTIYHVYQVQLKLMGMALVLQVFGCKLKYWTT